MGWDEAREASGTHWMTPFLAQTMIDPYDAVRFNTMAALRLQAGFDDLAVDYLADEDERRRVARAIALRYRQLAAPEGEIADPADLLTADVDAGVFRFLVSKRNDSVTALAE